MYQYYTVYLPFAHPVPSPPLHSARCLGRLICMDSIIGVPYTMVTQLGLINKGHEQNIEGKTK